MLDGKEAMPENGTCPEPDKGTSPTQQESAKEEKNRNENNPPPKKKKPQNWNRKCNLQDFQNNLWRMKRSGASIPNFFSSKVVHNKAGTFKYWIVQK